MNKDNTVPAALANTAEAEREAFKTYLESEDAKDARLSLSMNVEELEEWGFQLDRLTEDQDANALSVVSFFDHQIDHAEGVAQELKRMRGGYMNALGIPNALKAVAATLHERSDRDAKAAANGLRYGLELMENSYAKLPRELMKSLTMLGVPKSWRGRAVNDFFRLKQAVDEVKLPGEGETLEAS